MSEMIMNTVVIGGQSYELKKLTFLELMTIPSLTSMYIDKIESENPQVSEMVQKIMNTPQSNKALQHLTTLSIATSGRLSITDLLTADGVEINQALSVLEQYLDA